MITNYKVRAQNLLAGIDWKLKGMGFKPLLSFNERDDKSVLGVFYVNGHQSYKGAPILVDLSFDQRIRIILRELHGECSELFAIIREHILDCFEMDEKKLEPMVFHGNEDNEGIGSLGFEIDLPLHRRYLNDELRKPEKWQSHS